MKSSGRRRNLKYQRNEIISPKKGSPIWPGGSFVPVVKHFLIRGIVYQTSFHHQRRNPKIGKNPTTKASHNASYEVSISKHIPLLSIYTSTHVYLLLILGLYLYVTDNDAFVLALLLSRFLAIILLIKGELEDKAKAYAGAGSGF